MLGKALLHDFTVVSQGADAMMNVRGLSVLALLMATLAATGSPGNAGTSISITPSTVTVSPDMVFDVFICKDSLDLEFDGYQTVVTFDPEMLELISASEESVMTNSCWNRWWIPVAGEDSIFISHVLMCGGITVTGPGALSSLKFRALDEGTTVITCDYFWLTYQGYQIDDIAWHDGVVNIGMAGVVRRSGMEESLRIEAYPNPGRSFSICLAGGSEGCARIRDGTLDVCDVNGQIVAVLSRGMPVAAANGFGWDGGCDNGCAAAPGVYFIRFTAAEECIKQKVILLR